MSNNGFSGALFWIYFSFKGRITRQEYWFANLALIGVSLLYVYLRLVEYILVTEQMEIMIAAEGRVEFFIFAMLSVFFSITLSAKRFHDLGMTRLFALSLLIPVVSFAVFLFLGIAKGQPHDNKYGPAPNG